MTVLKWLVPSGLLATIVGGIVGVYAGVRAGGPIADTFGPGGLEGLGQAIFIIVVSASTGSALGAGLALRLSRQPHPLSTAILALPAVFFSVVVADRLASDASPSVQVGFMVGALWLARIVAMAWRRPSSVDHPED